jgi:DNA-directed RNA polymerase specialized sigma24 family protein
VGAAGLRQSSHVVASTPRDRGARPPSPEYGDRALGRASAEVEEFWSLVRQLPRRQAQSVALFYLYDLSVAEIAETLECSTGSVKSHLSRGRAALAKRLNTSLETDEEVER